MPGLYRNFDGVRIPLNRTHVPSARVPARGPTVDRGVQDFFAWLETPTAVPPEVDDTAVARSSERVLVVDDDPTLRRHGALFLQALGYKVDVCADGFAALDTVLRSSQRFDLLFTDVSMPKMDGRVLAARVRTLRPATKVLFTSGYQKDILFPFPDEYEPVQFLPKPYSASELALVIRRVLDGKA